MSSSFRSIFKNFSFSFVANVISMLISAVVIAIIPKVIGVAEYGYYQLYVFYASYTGFFHFGWCDGIYLRYGGIDYERYDRPLMSSQFWYLTFLETCFTGVLILLVGLFGFDVDRAFVLRLTALSILFMIPKTMVAYLLQISNRIREYSFVVIIEKTTCFVLTVLLLIAGYRSYQLLVAADITGKLAALILGCWYCRDIVLNRMSPPKTALREAWTNISVGVKLLVANIASMLILGIVRFAIERHWSIETFSKVSLAVSISNLLMVFINSVGVVLFPILRRVEVDRLNGIYRSLRSVLMILLYLMLLCYYPLQWILGKWLPNYAESFRYMSILFPMCVYDCKMTMLINTYLKALRKEKQLLMINLVTVTLSAVLTYVCVYMAESLTLSMVLVVFLFASRCTAGELLLGKYIGQRFTVQNLIDALMCILFMIISNLLPGMYAFFTFFAVYLGYIKISCSSMDTIIALIKNRTSSNEK